MALPMSLNRCLQLLVVGAALVLIAAPPANAQQSTQGTILATRERLRDELARLERAGASGQAAASLIRDRKSVVWGKSVDLGGRRIIKKKKKKKSHKA